MRYTSSRRFHFRPVRGYTRIILALRHSNHGIRRKAKRRHNRQQRRTHR